MDYRDQDGNGEGLYGARNENSVLFSLDSLTSLDKDSGNSAGSGFGSSGEASGLIDINTLARMSNSGSSENDDENNPPPMESVVFNQVVAKKSKQRIIIAVAIVVVVIAALSGVFYHIISNQQAEQEQKDKVAAEEAKTAAEEAKAKQDEIDQLKAEIAQAQADAKKRDVDQEKIQEELAKRQAKLDELMAKGGADTADAKPAAGGKKGGTAKAGGGSDSADAAPAPAKAKAPNKDELKNALVEANKKASKCGKGGTVTVSFNLSGNSAKGVKVVGGTINSPATLKCVSTVVEKNRWPDGTATGIKYTFKL